jgi:hypothetical protein
MFYLIAANIVNQKKVSGVKKQKKRILESILI